MSTGAAADAPSLGDVSAELRAAARLFSTLWNSRQGLNLRGVQRLPDTSEIAVLAARIAVQAGHEVEEAEVEGPLKWSLRIHDTLDRNEQSGPDDQPEPRTVKEFGFLLSVVAARLEALALNPLRVAALRQLGSVDIDKAVQACTVLRLLIRHSL